MRLLTWLLFESPLALAIAAGFVNFWLLVHWRRTGRGWPLLVGLMVSGLLFAIQYRVETPREAARRIITALQRGVERKQIGPFQELLAAGFRGGPLDREAFIEFVRLVMQDLDVYMLLRRELRVEPLADGRVVATARYVGNARYREQGGAFRARVEFLLGRSDGVWRLLAIRHVWVNDERIRLDRAARRVGPP